MRGLAKTNAPAACQSEAPSAGRAVPLGTPDEQREYNGTYTIVPHSVTRCRAAVTLSPGAFRVLVDFLDDWLRKTRNGRRDVGRIPFTWSACEWPACEETWNGYRSELEGHGFIECVNKRGGEYRWSKRYQQYRPSTVEKRRLAKHQDRLRRRAERAQAFRQRAETDPRKSGDASNPRNPGTGVPCSLGDDRPRKILGIPLRSESGQSPKYTNIDQTLCGYLLEGWFHA